MKKYFYMLIVALVAVAGITACSDDDKYEWATVSGNQVYFSNELASTLEISKKESAFTVPINRVKTDEAITVNLTHTSDFFTVPSSVDFAAGQSEATITITYDPDALAYDDFQKDTITIASADYTTIYGASTYAFSAGAYSPYKSLGTGTYVDNFYFTGVASYSVNILQNQEQPNVYRISNPYRGSYVSESDGDDYLEFTIQPEGAEFKGVTLTRGDLVTYGDFNTGYHHSNYDADIYLLHPSRMSANATEASWSYNRVLAWQEDGTPGQVQLAPYFYMFGVGGWNASQGDGNIIITFPGYAPKDYSLEVNYLGKFVDLGEQYHAQFSLTLGEDVEEVKYAVVAAEEADDAIDGIIDGSVESESATEGGIYNWPLEESGNYAVVAVAFAEGEAQTADYVNFKFETTPSAWESLGTGLFTDDIFIVRYADNDGNRMQPATYEVEIQENKDKPGLYRLVNPYCEAYPYNDPGDWDDSRDWYLEIDATDPDGVFIEAQEQGIDWGKGVLTIVSLGGYYLSRGNDFDAVKNAGYMGTLVDGVITFPENGLLYAIGDDGWYYGNTNSATKVVLPEAVTAKARKAAKNNHAVSVAKKSARNGQKTGKLNKALAPKKFELAR